MEYFFLFFIGVIFLLQGADALINGAINISKHFKIPYIITGLTIVALGTSLPELVVNVIASLNGNGEIAFGNIVGSNIFNISLVLGMTLLLHDVYVSKTLIKMEIPLSILSIIILLVTSNNIFLNYFKINYLPSSVSIILLGLFIIFLWHLFFSFKNDNDYIIKKNNESQQDNINVYKNIGYVFLGMIGLYVGGELTISQAINIAKSLNVSEYIISLTLVAMGTSLPELITSLVAFFKKSTDIAIGNIIGSNLINVCLILPISSFITPIYIPNIAVYDTLFLFMLNVLIVLFIIITNKSILKRWQGALLVTVFVGYLVFLTVRV